LIVLYKNIDRNQVEIYRIEPSARNNYAKYLTSRYILNRMENKVPFQSLIET